MWSRRRKAPGHAVFINGYLPVDPSGKYAYVANEGSSNVSQYMIGVNGALTLKSVVCYRPLDEDAGDVHRGWRR